MADSKSVGPEQVRIPCSIMRGGTSKGVFFLEEDVPPPGPARDRLLKRVMGTPDPMQIDGLGGTHLVTSKIAIVARSRRPGVDVDYTFAQAEIDRDVIDYEGNCGNISAGVGPFAIDAGLVAAGEATTVVTIHNTNTGKVLVAHVPTRDGRARVGGTFAISGVPGTGAEIFMDYGDTIGAKTGRLLPTGQPREAIALEDGRSVAVTLCDVANTTVFVAARDLGLEGDEPPGFFTGAVLDLLREIRGKAAERLGFCADWRQVDAVSPFLPFVMLVSPARDRVEHDLVARMIFMNRCHGAMAGTGAICLAAASRIPRSVACDATSGNWPGLRIAHPSGVMEVAVASSADADAEGGVRFERLGFARTARKIMDGFVYVPRDAL